MSWEALPSNVQDLFSRGGKLSLVEGHFRTGEQWGPAGDMPHGIQIEKNAEGRPVWTSKLFKTLRLKASLGTEHLSYADRPHIAVDLAEALKRFPVKGKKVLVVCSVLPWVEALVLELGASQVYTTPFHDKKPVWSGASSGEHSPVTILTHDDLFRLVIDSKGGHDAVLQHEHEEVRFDAVICMSCVQHAGLGAYGEPLDPDGDIIMMKEMRKWARPGGRLYISLPTGDADALFFNSHRLYGKTRFAELTSNAGWEFSHIVHRKFDEAFHGLEWDNQPVFVLSRTADNQ
jgi:SAM-dependent methyltransferase